MRKFALLLLAFAIILFGLRTIAGDAGFTSYVVRDGLLVVLIGIIVFAFNATPLYQPIVTHVRAGWQTTGRLLWITGVVAALMGGALMLVDVSGSTVEAMRLTLWLLGLLLMLVGAGWPNKAQHYASPSHHWDVDGQGTFIRTRTDDPGVEEAGAEQPVSLGRTVEWVTLLIIVLIGAWLRLWKLSQLPGGCVDAECALGLQLMQGGRPLIEAGFFSPYGWLAQSFFAMTGEGLISLRMASACFGIATLPLVFFAARQISAATGALLATTLLALSPWHIISSRGAEPWIVLPLLLSVGIWAVLRGLTALDRGGTGRIYWALAGVSLGATVLIAPQLRFALWLWVGLIVVLVFIIRRGIWQQSISPMFILVAATLLTSLPVMAARTGTGDFTAAGALLPGLSTELLSTRGWRLGLPLLATISAAFALSGMGVLARWLWRLTASTLLLGALMLAGQVVLLRTEADAISMATLLLAVLPSLFLFAAVALDQLLGQFTRAWSRVIPPAVILGVTLGLFLLLAGRDTVKLMGDLERMTATDNPAMTAMATYLVETFDMDAAEPIPEQTIIFAPPALFETPSARLLAGSLLESAQIQPLADVNDLIAATAGGFDVRLLATAADQPLFTLLEHLYPDHARISEYDDEGQTRFVHFVVNAADAPFHPGLSGLYYDNANFTDLISDQRDGQMRFDWALRDDLRTPFSVSWTGSLLAPESGRYHFTVEGADAPDATFSLQLDDQIVLDSSLGLFEKSEILADGHAGLRMRYATTSTDPPPLVVYWTRPDGVRAPIPMDAMVSPALPNLGLLGAYYADTGFAGPALELRKELLPGASITVPGAASVVWRGKVAASRAGEYAFAVVGDGHYEMMLDEHTVLNRAVIDADGSSPAGYAETRIYLDRGWHDIDLRFVPATETSRLQLRWQPPGGSMAPLPSVYLAPIRAEITELDYALPPPPALSNEQLGDDRFALSQVDAASQPQPSALPTDLTPMTAFPIWRTNTGCGPGPTQLARPHGAAIDMQAGRIYVADTGNRRIAIYNLDGDPMGAITDERFLELADVARAPGGLLAALDAAEGQLFRVDPDAQTVTHFPVDASFYHPRGLGVDRLGMIAVADTGGARVVIIEPGGTMVAEFGGQGTPFGRNQPVDALLADGLWSITAEDGRLWNLYVDASIPATGRAVSMDGPQLAETERGAFFLTDPARRTLFYHRRNGQPMAQFPYLDVFETPTGVATAKVGDLFHLVVVDTARCSLSLWTIPAETLEE